MTIITTKRGVAIYSDYCITADPPPTTSKKRYGKYLTNVKM